MEARASAKYLRGSAQKARLVIDMIRGKRAAEALAILQYTNKRAAEGIEKCVRSAIANATEAAEKNNIAVDPDDLWVKACFVDQGPTKRRFRFRPAPQGRAYRERRHFCHVTVLLSSEDKNEGEGARGGKKAVGAGKKRVARDGGAAAKPAAKARGGRKGDAGASAQSSKAAGESKPRRAAEKSEAAETEGSAAE